MAASHFFIGLGAGVALLTIPVLVLAPGLDLPGRFEAWIEGPPPAPPSSSIEVPTRPVRGYVPGTTQSVDEPPTPPPTLSPAVRPTEPPAAPLAATPVLGSALAPPGNGLRTGVIRAGGSGAFVRHAAGVESADDPLLPDGSPVLVSAGPGLRIGNDLWRGVRGLGGVVGWVLASQLQVDGEEPQPGSQAATAGQPLQVGGARTPAQLQGTPTATTQDRVRIVNTGGVGVALRGSPNDADRRPSGLADGATVAVVDRLGNDWVHVRADTGQDGWVPARYVAPAS